LLHRAARTYVPQNFSAPNDMKFLRAFLLGGLAGVGSVWAVYAPVPEQEQGKVLTVTARAAATYDSNIFGAANGAIDSMVYEFSPKAVFNAAIGDQTFVSGTYQLTLDHFSDRPGDRTLDSHNVIGRFAHAFSKATNVDFSDTFSATRNPESLLAGIALNTDQSFISNELDGRFVTALSAKAGLTLKARSLTYRYRNSTLRRDLDRTENLYGLAADYAVLSQLKAVGEYRHQTIGYRSAGSGKDKYSDFLMAGADYAPSEKTLASARLGFESRHRDGERGTTAPYVELSARQAYGEKSFVSAGYAYTFEEASDVARFTDTRVNRLFANVQHALSGALFASAAIDWEPSQLRGRRGQINVNETSIHSGATLTWQSMKRWTVTASYDYDRVNSDDPARGLDRHRVGLGVGYLF